VLDDYRSCEIRVRCSVRRKPSNAPIDIQIPVGYPATNPEIAIPELDGKTAKMYRLEFIEAFLTYLKRREDLSHRSFQATLVTQCPSLRDRTCYGSWGSLIFSYLTPKLAPWLAVEIPDLVSKGIIVHKEASASS
jgi:ufm1-conjugating enzyme 1